MSTSTLAPDLYQEVTEPAILTASVNGWGIDTEDESVPQSIETTVESVVRSYEEGAAIAHLHGIFTEEDGEIEFDVAAWGELHDRIREECDVVTQLGYTIGPTEERIEMFERQDAAPDMLSVTLTDNDHHVVGDDMFSRHSREEMEHLCTVCLDHDIVPELEVFHSGSVWNLEYLAERGAIAAPYWINLPFGMYGGLWCPGTPDQLDARRSLLPGTARWHTAYFCGRKGSGTPERQRRFYAHALGVGGGVRIGVEENSDYTAGSSAEATAELVGGVADLSRTLGREVATPDEARALLEIPS